MRSLAVAILLLIPSFVQAQEQLSLGDAVKLGLSSNYQIQIAQKNVEIARISNNWGDLGRYPSLDLSLTQNNSISDQSNNPTAFIQDNVVSNSLDGGLNLNWTLFNGFGVKINKEKLENLQEQSEGNAAVLIETTIQSIILAYYNAQLQQKKLEALGNVMNLSRDRYKYFQQRQEMGTNSSFDVLQYQTTYYTDSTNYMLQELAVKNSRRNLNLLMGQKIEQAYLLTNPLTIGSLNYDLAALKTKMISNNNNLKNQYINQSILKRDIGLAKSTVYPVVTFTAGANNSKSSFKIGDFSSTGTTLNYYANFALNFNLFNGGRVKRAIQNAKVQEEITNLTINELEQSLTNELISALEMFDTRKKILELAKANLKSSEKSLKLAEERYTIGSIFSFDFRDIQLNYLNVKVTQLESIYNLIDTNTELLRLTGGILEEFNK
jgi:outer membrane protein